MPHLRQQDGGSTEAQTTTTETGDCTTSAMSQPEQLQHEAAQDCNDDQSQSSQCTVVNTSNPELARKERQQDEIPQLEIQSAEDDIGVEPGTNVPDSNQPDTDHPIVQNGPESTTQESRPFIHNTKAQALAQVPPALEPPANLPSSVSSSRCASNAAPTAETPVQQLHTLEAGDKASRTHVGEGEGTPLPLSPESPPMSRNFHFLKCGLSESAKDNDILTSDHICPHCISLAASPAVIDATRSPVDNVSTHGKQPDTHTTMPKSASRLLILVPALPIPKSPCLKCELYEDDADIERLSSRQTCPRCASFAKIPCPKCELYEQDRDIELLGRGQACPRCALYATPVVDDVDGNGPWMRPMILETENWSKYEGWGDSD